MYIEIIDDNTQLAHYVRKSFEKKWDSVEVYNSRNSFLHESKFEADIFLIDINLWDGNGLDMVEHLRVSEKVQAPIIIVSWQIDAEVRIEWIKLWVNGFIEKPFSTWELHEEVNKILTSSDASSKKKHIPCLSKKEKNKLHI